MKTKILNEIKDLAAKFLYYDRKEDENLTESDLKGAIHSGEISVPEIAEAFKNEIRMGLVGPIPKDTELVDREGDFCDDCGVGLNYFEKSIQLCSNCGYAWDE